MAKITSEPIRALEVMNDTPAGCIVHMEREDKHVPHVRAGEWVLVDTSDREPSRSELFLIEWTGGRRDVMQASHCSWAKVRRKGEEDWSKEPSWMLEPLHATAAPPSSRNRPRLGG